MHKELFIKCNWQNSKKISFRLKIIFWFHILSQPCIKNVKSGASLLLRRFQVVNLTLADKSVKLHVHNKILHATTDTFAAKFPCGLTLGSGCQNFSLKFIITPLASHSFPFFAATVSQRGFHRAILKFVHEYKSIKWRRAIIENCRGARWSKIVFLDKFVAFCIRETCLIWDVWSWHKIRGDENLYDYIMNLCEFECDPIFFCIHWMSFDYESQTWWINWISWILDDNSIFQSSTQISTTICIKICFIVHF